MSLEGHFCWEDCDEGPHGCICGNDCPNPRTVSADDTEEFALRLATLGSQMREDENKALIAEAVTRIFGASRPFTEEDVEVAAKAMLSELGGTLDEMEQMHIDAARAALDAVTARHNPETGGSR